ncbi:scavenger receptor cysteine-rich domain-containing group B protein-like [Pyxicephalus adspersus]|uniref:scavenger receptor cysteine-rich domain-containing group B protein-like n=1 Tax=Pyxicephalus adspersus TaxID=30357 RepID=UPI003B5C4886
MSLLILLLAATSCLTVSAQGCSNAVHSSAHITIFADIFEYFSNLNEFELLRNLVENFNSSSNEIKIVLNCHDPGKLKKYILENQALGSAEYSLTTDYIITYINSMIWQPPTTTERTSHILIMLLKKYNPHSFMKPKIQKLKRAGLQIFPMVYDTFKRFELDEMASYPTERHSFSRLNFESIESAAEALTRSVCWSIETKERGAKKAILSEVRLAGGRGPCQGRVEVNYKQTWGSLSDEHWNRHAADVICRQLKCGPSVEALKGDAFGPSTEHFLEKVDCSGDEDDVSQCLLGKWTLRDNERSQHSAGVTCLSSGVSDVRLVNGSGRCDGIVEVSVDNVWRRLSLWNFDLREGAVICREMGCGPLEKTQEVFSTPGTQTVERSRCYGTESQFSECRISLWKAQAHLPDVHAAVTCSETALSRVSLAGESGSCSGTVKIFSNGMWSTVCAMDWSTAEEAVLCKQQGCGPALELVDVKKVELSRGETPVTHFRNVHCSGSETQLSQCSAVMTPGYKCYFGEAVATCSQAEISAVKLVDGDHSCSGRVEVLYKKRWGTVCDQHWDLADASVVCRQVGCGRALQAPGGAYFGPGSGDIWLEKVFCNGTESSLSRCGAVMSKKNLCVHSQDASVICEGKAQD